MPTYTNWGPGAVRKTADAKPVEVGDTVSLSEEQAAGLRGAGIHLEEAKETRSRSSSSESKAEASSGSS